MPHSQQVQQQHQAQVRQQVVLSRAASPTRLLLPLVSTLPVTMQVLAAVVARALVLLQLKVMQRKVSLQSESI